MVCGEYNILGYKKRDCAIWNWKYELNNQNAKTKDSFVAMVFDQINADQSDNDWWVNLGASKHVCKDRSFFWNLGSIEHGKVLYIAILLPLMSKGYAK